jgi:acyl carrier protein
VTEKDIFERLKKLIVELLEIDEAKVIPKASFTDDLNADSLDLVEFITVTEDAFEIEISDEDAERIHTVEDAVNYIKLKT